NAKDREALLRLAESYGFCGVGDRAKIICAEIAAGENPDWSALAEVMNQLGDNEGVRRFCEETLNSTSCDAGDHSEFYALERCGRKREAEQLVLRAAEAGEGSSLLYLVGYRLTSGDTQGAYHLAEEAIAAGCVEHLEPLVKLGVLRETGLYELIATGIAESGDPGGFTALALAKVFT